MPVASDPALAVQQRFMPHGQNHDQSRRNFTQTFGFRIQYIAPSRDKVCFPPSKPPFVLEFRFVLPKLIGCKLFKFIESA